MSSEIGSIQPNPYLFNIENRKKRRARLAHEIGAGAQCLRCHEKCPGFELHYWRKICQNCRCSKDDHDVQDEDEDIGKIVIGKLFERPIRTKEEEQQYSYGTDLEITDESTGKKEKLRFDWVPPGVANSIAKRYMEMLPPEKRPVAGTEAAKERRRQLEQQLPLYDMDVSERCENLPPEEIQNFEKYLKVLRKNVAGQASVQEIVPLQPRHYAIPLRSDSYPTKKSTVTLARNVIPPPDGDMMRLEQTPLDNLKDYDRKVIKAFECSKTSHIVHSPNQQLLEGDTENALNNNAITSSHSDSKQLQGRHVSFGEPRSCDRDIPMVSDALAGMSFSSKYQPLHSQYALPKGSHNHSVPQRRQDATYPTDEECGQPAHNLNLIDTHSGIRNLTGPKPFIVNSTLQPILPGQYSFDLGGSEARNQGDRLSSPLPYSVQSLVGPQGLLSQSGKVSKQLYQPEGPAELQQLRALEKIIPIRHSHDSSNHSITEYGSNVSVILPQESQILKRDSSEQELMEMGQFFCQYCGNSMKPGDVAVICERAGPGKYWHPRCFVCVTCNELLADLIYFYKDGQVFCGRHYTQAADIPRCKACDELIFSETWTRADGFDWHIQHYCCFICDTPLAGMKYIPDGKGFPHCMSCYMAFKAKMCEVCEDKISPDETRAGFRGYFYHTRPECFCCYSCRKPMMGERFKMVKNWIFCSQNCISAACDDIVRNPNSKEKE